MQTQAFDSTCVRRAAIQVVRLPPANPVRRWWVRWTQDRAMAQAAARTEAAATARAALIADLLLALEAAPLFGLQAVAALPPVRAVGQAAPAGVIVRLGSGAATRSWRLTPDEARLVARAITDDAAWPGCLEDALCLTRAADAANTLTLHAARGGA